MSVQIVHYVIFGIKYKYIDDDIFEEYEDSAFKSKIGNKDGITAIVDGMDGKYVFIGKILAKASAERCDGFDITEISYTEDTVNLVISKCTELIGHIPNAPKLYVFTHYS